MSQINHRKGEKLLVPHQSFLPEIDYRRPQISG